MKKIFILTGETSGDKLASRVISKLKILNPNIEYLAVGGENLKSLGIQTIYDLKEITYLGFTRVLLNIFKINNKINHTVKSIIEFKPDINDKKDIKKALATLNKLNNYSFSQGAIIKNNKVLAIEGNDGTHKMLKRIKKKEKKLKGILAKFPKKKQDLRIDLPTIGTQTLIQCKKAGLKGIVLKNKKNVCLEKNFLIQLANKNRMFIVVK